MKYNIDYISIKYSLAKALMFNANEGILDISYYVIDRKIELQVVLLNGSILSEQEAEGVKESLLEYDVNVKEIYITKEQFNENIGEWTPKYYEWLENVLFSKSEVL